MVCIEFNDLEQLKLFIFPATTVSEQVEVYSKQGCLTLSGLWLQLKSEFFTFYTVCTTQTNSFHSFFISSSWTCRLPSLAPRRHQTATLGFFAHYKTKLNSPQF